MNPPSDAVFIADGTAALFRAYFGMRSVQSPDGVEVGGLLGLGQWLARLVVEQRPSHIALVFDAGQRTFRNDIDAAYKANRGDPPEDLVPQFDRALRMVDALGFVRFCVPGYEADDLMATLAKKIRKTRRAGVLVTPDKDILQLVNERTLVMEPKNFGLVDAAQVEERYGVRPEQMVDYQALCGDSSDNIPGVRGVGPKSAAQLLRAFNDLDNLYEELDRVAEMDIRGAKSLATKLRTHKVDAQRSRQLVALRDDVELNTENARLADLRYQGPRADADQLFDEFGFHAPLRKLRAYADGIG